jgi:hypothetical protein
VIIVGAAAAGGRTPNNMRPSSRPGDGHRRVEARGPRTLVLGPHDEQGTVGRRPHRAGPAGVRGLVFVGKTANTLDFRSLQPGGMNHPSGMRRQGLRSASVKSRRPFQSLDAGSPPIPMRSGAHALVAVGGRTLALQRAPIQETHMYVTTEESASIPAIRPFTIEIRARCGPHSGGCVNRAAHACTHGVANCPPEGEVRHE